MIRTMFCALACLSGPVWADPSGAIDFEALFAANAAEVEEVMSSNADNSRWRLRTPGGVTVWADGTEGARRFSAMDETPAGAVGCLWNAYADIARLHLSCPDALSEDEAAQLQEFRGRIGDFIADNTYPPVARADFWAYWQDATRADDGLACDSIMDPPTGPLVQTLLSPQFVNVLDGMLAVPRLPAETPCF